MPLVLRRIGAAKPGEGRTVWGTKTVLERIFTFEFTSPQGLLRGLAEEIVTGDDLALLTPDPMRPEQPPEVSLDRASRNRIGNRLQADTPAARLSMAPVPFRAPRTEVEIGGRVHPLSPPATRTRLHAWTPRDPVCMIAVINALLRRMRKKSARLPLCYQFYAWVGGKRWFRGTGACGIVPVDSPLFQDLDPIDPPAEGEDPADPETESPIMLEGWHKDPDHRSEFRVWDVCPSSETSLRFRPRGWLPARSRFFFGTSDLEVNAKTTYEVFAPELRSFRRLCHGAAAAGEPVYLLGGSVERMPDPTEERPSGG